MPLDGEHETRLERLLQYDLEHFASVLGYAQTPTPLSNDVAAALLNLAEHHSRKIDDTSQRVSLLICGLMTEYHRDEWAAAPAFIINLLSRLGLSPSMRMTDHGYRAEDDTFDTLGSFSTEVAVVARCIQSTVVAAEIKSLLLSEFQLRAWRAIDEHRRIGISAPTSAGKSHVLIYKLLDTLHKSPGIAVFIVPTISLIQQVSRDVRQAAAHLGMKDVGVYQSYSDGIAVGHRQAVFVLTQERAQSAFAHPGALKGCQIVIIDEVQNIERITEEDDERAHTLLEVIHEIETSRDAKKIVISGPRVENIGQLAKDLFGASAISVSAGLPPVVNITYSFTQEGAKRKKKTTVLNQYVDISSKRRQIELTGADAVKKAVFSKQAYSSEVHNLMSELAEKLTTGHGTLLFSPTSEQATKTAIEIAGRIQLPVNAKQASSLIEYVADTVHERYALAISLSKGIGFHHGKMPHHIRMTVEYAFAQQWVSAIVCTTTLMQGINLPAKNLIVRNPNLFLSRGENAATLTAYEFANLRGRAGRLMKDFVGRALILDESFFPEQERDDYVSAPGTSVASGYGRRFDEHRSGIIDQLCSADPVNDRVASDLVTYIRQSIYRYREGALPRLSRVGISLSDDEFSSISAIVARLNVARDIVERNPTWDPLDLEILHRANSKNQLPLIPKTPFHSDLVANLTAVVKRISELTPSYFFRYLGDVPEKYIKWVAICSQKWATERPLKEIIGWVSKGEDLTWEVIDKRLALLLNAVVYDLPKLIRPVVMMQDLENPLLGFIELGAYRPDSRRLIELGLARETAIRCTSKFSAIIDTPASDTELLTAAVASAQQLSFWDQFQVDQLR